MSNKGLLRTNQIVVRIFAVILTVEALVMVFIWGVGLDDEPVLAALVDVALLALLAAPGIYLLVVKPFVLARDLALEEVNQLALTDSLTQLANRRHFQQRFAQEHGRSGRSGTELSLIMLDIDHFKAYNDRYGHVLGDACLKQVAAVLRARMTRPADLAARFGGEEFVCILPETGLEGACTIAEAIRREVEALGIAHVDSSTSEHVTVSAGVASSSGDREGTPEHLINEADKLLYLAKAKGRNRIESDASVLDTKRAGSFIRLVWRDAYVSGNELIDRQHRQLFKAADDLLSGVLSGRGTEDVERLVAGLLRDLRQHFGDELRIISALGYPDAKAHGQDHARLLARAEEFAEDCKRGKLSVGELFQFLAEEVIIKHLLTEDRKFFPFTRGDSVSAAG